MYREGQRLELTQENHIEWNPNTPPETQLLLKAGNGLILVLKGLRQVNKRYNGALMAAV
ncbi:hypothetical protein D3C76_1775090 [compost metagenome]